ncbi:MFS transporter [Haloarchaeobius sp. DT45]|uniref:MFS transporter n=1 Tax=Haloarchaeobius sp. DT45 TaxID=3446116 RepID=UPI003F6A90B3
MRLAACIREGDWLPVVGASFYVALLSGGYYYNVTFVQLGLLDLGTRLVGMTRGEVSLAMAVLALATVAVALPMGWLFDRRGWSADLDVKLRLVFGVVVVQTVLTAVAPFVRSVPGFYAWVLACSVALGVGVPATFGLAVELVPVPDRGWVGAAIAGSSFFLAAIYPLEWNVGAFSRVMVAAMVPALGLLGFLVVRRPDVLDRFAAQREMFGRGRFCRPDPVRMTSPRFLTALVLMFGVYFVDSFGFLRIVETPVYVLSAWQSPDFSVHLFIAVVHVVGAVMAGVLYVNFELKAVFLWTFGLFSVTHLLYSFDAATAPAGETALVLPLFYAMAVSFYTTINFALWPDLSTPQTVGRYASLGVGMAGWVATFLSTGLALYFDQTGVSLVDHLSLVNALALVLLVGLALGLYLSRLREHARGETA